MEMTSRLRELIWRKVAVVGNICECWPWTAYVDPKGYGRFSGKKDGEAVCLLAHRATYVMTFGPVEKGLDLDHLCRNRSCANPWHLEPVTRKENLRRGEGVGAANAERQRAKTHCPFGHPYDKENTRMTRDGRSRVCIECQRRHGRANSARRYAIVKALRAPVTP